MEENSNFKLLVKSLKGLLFLPFWYFQRLLPRDKNIWVFGSWFGQRYSDNSRAMYEFVLENRPDIKPFWITFDVIKRFFEVFVIAILFDLVCALLIRGLKGISFNEGFVITMYAFAMQSIGQIFDSLYGLSICGYLGAFIGIVYFIIAIRNTNNAKNIDIRE